MEDQSGDPVPECNLKVVVGAQFWAILAGAFPGIREKLSSGKQNAKACVWDYYYSYCKVAGWESFLMVHAL